VHVLAVLAYKEGDAVCSEFISQSVNTNPVIIRRLLLLLQKARLVETTKGARAGSRLSRTPTRINLAEVYRAVRCAETFGMPRRTPNDHCPVGACIKPLLQHLFVSAEQALERELSHTTLAKMLQQIKRRSRTLKICDLNWPPRAACKKQTNGPAT